MRREIARRLDALESSVGNKVRPYRLVFCQHGETLTEAMTRQCVPADANVRVFRWLAPTDTAVVNGEA